MNSYSYRTSDSNVLKWDYAYHNWNFTSTTMGGWLAAGRPFKAEIQGETVLSMLAGPFGVKPSTLESPLLMAGLGCAALTVVGIAANKYKKARSLKSDDFVFESASVEKVMMA